MVSGEEGQAMRPEFLAMRIIGVVLLVMTGLTGASLAASFSPPQATDQYEHAFSNIQLQPDPRIFAVNQRSINQGALLNPRIFL